MSALFHAVFDTNVLLDFWVFANPALPLRTALGGHGRCVAQRTRDRRIE
jgi:hypothetical protein